jgi:hypothetical protein
MEDIEIEELQNVADFYDEDLSDEEDERLEVSIQLKELLKNNFFISLISNFLDKIKN